MRRISTGWGRAGQSVAEYMVIGVALIVALLALRPLVDAKANALMNEALRQVNTPAGTADAIVPSR